VPRVLHSFPTRRSSDLLQPRPGGRGDDLARLRGDVAEADLLLFLAFGQVRVVAPGHLAERLPGLDRDFAVGLRREHQDRLAGVDVVVDLGPAGGRAVEDAPVEVAEQFDLGLRIPAYALAAVAELLERRAHRSEAREGVGIIPLDQRDTGHRLARNRIDLALQPVLR